MKIKNQIELLTIEMELLNSEFEKIKLTYKLNARLYGPKKQVVFISTLNNCFRHLTKINRLVRGWKNAD